WPSAEVAVMGAQGAVQLLHRRADAAARAAAEVAYRESFLTPWIAAERGLVDDVIDPADSRRAVASAFATLDSKRERLPERKHANGPL
ncbi:MAG: carboxyl transferase domain-containing protein, partial [Acidimicrobiales bacterium]